jgi:hypothetical protein
VKGLLHPNPIPALEPRIYDIQGGWVMPACAEAHNHAATAKQPETLKRFLEQGILFVQNPENLPSDRVGAGVNTPDGVDIRFANGALTSTGGHPFGLIKRGLVPHTTSDPFAYTVDSMRDVDEKLGALLATHPDFVKIMLVYSEEYEKRKFRPEFAGRDPYFSRRGLDPDLVPAIVSRVHAKGLRVVAHVESAADFHVAVSAGVDQVAHLPGFWPSNDTLKSGDFSRYVISEQDARLAEKKRISVITTLGESLTTEQVPEAMRAKLVDVYRTNIARLRRHKVRILIGSDQFRTTSREEVVALARSGLFTPTEILTSWCQTTPREIFPKRKLGKLADGYEADFVVFGGDPRKDISNIKDVRAVFKLGQPLVRSRD